MYELMKSKAHVAALTTFIRSVIDAGTFSALEDGGDLLVAARGDGLCVPSVLDGCSITKACSTPPNDGGEVLRYYPVASRPYIDSLSEPECRLSL